MVGIIPTIPGGRNDDCLQRLVQPMCNGSDLQSGHCTFGLAGVSIGWVSPSDSPPNAQPSWNADRTICLLFLGEEFSTCGRDAGRGPTRPAGSEAEVSRLVRLYEEKGPDFVAELNGWFAGVVVNLREGTVHLFNDRYGLGRIYCHESNDGFYFASEAKSLLAALPSSCQLDQRGLAEFFSVGCVLQNRTLFAGISLLPPGSLWTFRRERGPARRRYFTPDAWEHQDPLPAAEYGARLQEVFGRIVPRHLNASEPVALSLTGGLDSRLLLAWARAEPGRLPCYTFGGPYRDCADVRIARRLAETCRQPHTTIRIENDFFHDFPSLAEKTVYQSDGTMDVSGAVELCVNRRAREIAPVRLTGNYGSEILRRKIAFRPGRLDTSLFTPEFCRLLEQAAETYRQEAAGHRLSFVAFKQVPWYHQARFSVERSQLTVRSPFLDNDLVALAYRAPPELAASIQPLLQLIAAGNLALDSIGTDRAYRRRALPIVTRLTSAWQEFTAKAEYAYDYGMPVWLARADHALSRLKLERLFLGRHKFYHFRVWYRDQLGDYVRASCLGSASLPSCYRAESVKRIVEGHLSGRSNHTLDLHKLLTVLLTERLFVRPSCPG